MFLFSPRAGYPSYATDTFWLLDWLVKCLADLRSHTFIGRTFVFKHDATYTSDKGTFCTHKCAQEQ